jgi:hypothetical protein
LLSSIVGMTFVAGTTGYQQTPVLCSRVRPAAP